MIELATTASPGTAAAVPGSSGTPVPADPGNSATRTAFADALAAGEAQAQPAALPATQPATAVAATPVADFAARQILAGTPAAPTATGKVLPDMPGDTSADQPTPVGILVPVLPLLRALRPLAADVAKPAEPETKSGEAGESDTGAAEEAERAATNLVLAFVLPVQAAADPATPAAATAPTAAPQLPAVIAAQVLGQPLQQTLPAQQGVLQPSAGQPPERTLAVPANPAGAANPHAASAAFTLASPAAPIAPGAVRLRPVIEHATEALAAATSDAAATTALLDGLSPAAAPAGAITAPAGVPASASLTAHSPTYDFATVVDRLLAARDAAQTNGGVQPVALAVRHAEFGEVSVRFEHRADGLSVSLASPDPDFARAVHAAAPSSGGSDAASSGHSGQQGQQAFTANAQSHGNGNPRGTTLSQAQRAGEAENPAQPAATTDPQARGPRGIYA